MRTAIDSSVLWCLINQEPDADFWKSALAAAWLAGQTFKTYRKAGGPRARMIPDFLIAAHAQHQADRLATVDRGYLREYFPKLKLLTPSK
jgi:predicted nucleic acid-binding protein